MLKQITLLIPQLFILTLCSCSESSTTTTNQGIAKSQIVNNTDSINCFAIVCYEKSNSSRKEIASISIGGKSTDSLYNLSIQTSSEFGKYDIPCNGNVFIARSSNHPLSKDTGQLRFRWVKNNKLIILYDYKLEVLKQETSIRNISIRYESL